MNHWIGVVSLEHVQRGLSGGFAQMNHGKEAPLKRMKAGDGLIYYSPRLAYPKGEGLQAFTAIGRIRDGRVYAHDMSAEGAPGFVPWRIDVDYWPCAQAAIAPLIDKLDFIRNKQHWGAAFRFGQVNISAKDFATIAQAMGCEDRLR
jgi:EVE domain